MDEGAPEVLRAANRRNRAFVGLWSTQLGLLLLASGSGVALTLYVFSSTHSAAALGLVTALSYFSAIYVAPAIGAALDRTSRRAAIIAANLVNAATSGMLAVGIWLDVASMALVLPLAFLAGASATALGLALQASVRVLRAESDLTRANGVTSLIESAPLLVGPLVGAAVYATTSPAAVFAIEAAGSLLSAGIVARSRWMAESGDRGPAGAADGPARLNPLAGMAAGFFFIWSVRDLRVLQGWFAAFNCVNGFAVPLVLALVVAQSAPAVEAFNLAAVSIAGSAGLLVGSGAVFLLAGRIRRDRMIWGGVLFGAVTGRLLFTGVSGAVPWAAMIMLRNAAAQLTNAPLTALWQERVPVEMQATVFGCRRLLGQGLFPVAVLAGGAILEASARPAGGVAGAAVVLLLVAGACELIIGACLAGSKAPRNLAHPSQLEAVPAGDV